MEEKDLNKKNMDKFYIYGPTQIIGSVSISGSKNSILPILFASILTKKIVNIYNIPKIKDVEFAIQLLCNFGVRITYNNFIRIDASYINIPVCISKKLMRSIRASIWILAPLVTRLGKGKIFFPGGCAIGNRPINLHIDGLRRLGALIKIEKNYVEVTTKKKLRGSHIVMEKVSVGATITIMLAATLAIGITIIDNAALEPEVVDTANFLRTLGAKIYGIGTSKIIISGVHKLFGGTYRIMPDRIETGTFLVAAAISRGKIVCKSTKPSTLRTVLLKLEEAGADIKVGNDWISLDMHGNRPKAVTICTSPYPGFPTDMQAQFSLLNLIAEGKSIIIETIFENRFMHIPELIKMGANVKIINNKIVCYGVQILFGREVIATDLRSSACLILAGCVAQGTTIVNKIFHLDRGYDSFEEKLRSVGAKITRVKSSNKHV